MATMTDGWKKEDKRYALVSSLYGPGAVVCWYLTITALLVSWTLHPHKRKSGSIDIELVAVLALPAIAAGHAIFQVQTLLRHTPNYAIPVYRQYVAAAEAPLDIVEIFMAFSVILFIISLWMFCLRRALAVCLTGLLCFAVECYVHFSRFSSLDLRYKPGLTQDASVTAFTRYFVADFPVLVILILVVLAVCASISGGIAFLMLSSAPAVPNPPAVSLTNVRRTYDYSTLASIERQQHTKSQSERRSFKAITLVSTLFLPITFIATLFPMTGNAFSLMTFTTADTFWLSLPLTAARLRRYLMPRSACSITDLDQAVTAATGAIALAFRIYSVAKIRYKSWASQTSESPRWAGVELLALRSNPDD